MPHFAPRRALIVIDVQNEYVSGKCRIEYPEVSLSLANIGRAMDAAREASIPVVVVQHVLPAEAPIFALGSDGVALHPVVASRPRNVLIHKHEPSTFAGTSFASWLGQNDIDTLTVVGYMTHHCNDSTIRQAMHEGFDVELLSDASGSLSYANSAGSASARQIHHVTTVVMASAYAAVMTTTEWLTLLAGGQSAPRDNIFTSHQRALALRAAAILEEVL